jgi:AcrR family transcriptional regulator
VIGLRERKKQQTRQQIFDVAQRLFARRGFEKVTVAEIARAANVSEMTVFNYFPTKEDLFYEGMQVFEGRLVDAVRDRRRGEDALSAFRRRVVEGASNLEAGQRADAIVRAGRIIAASPSLQARERELVEAYTDRLAAVLGPDIEAKIAAATLMAAHRALVAHTRERAAAGARGPSLAEDFRRQARRAFGRLERGLGGYAVRA